MKYLDCNFGLFNSLARQDELEGAEVGLTILNPVELTTFAEVAKTIRIY